MLNVTPVANSLLYSMYISYMCIHIRTCMCIYSATISIKSLLFSEITSILSSSLPQTLEYCIIMRRGGGENEEGGEEGRKVCGLPQVAVKVWMG